jgi:hypothetical protein
LHHCRAVPCLALPCICTAEEQASIHIYIYIYVYIYTYIYIVGWVGRDTDDDVFIDRAMLVESAGWLVRYKIIRYKTLSDMSSSRSDGSK